MMVTLARYSNKQPKYRSEIENHLHCQGRSCAGASATPRLTRLLGRSADSGNLVFARLLPRHPVLHRFASVTVWKKWLLHLIDGLGALHALGTAHRDIQVDNILFAYGGQTLFPYELEGR
ncbi:Serine/threonine-protein kinase-like domain protein [Akanthomyces lecanii RCEF 1005]|uniref:Serine/threonine-protein kinase-like domain protein n=1 Tax=Akanthomyces lecanii RCEF 1005 TaxID=1081108 RepID=A0A168GQ14_CORDF|nr:Serine/threonine-protein kinase-like domain protein [Akanthomyces lecanii RCEF 1005]